MQLKRHPDIEKLGFLFDVGETPLHKDVGLRCRFKHPECPAERDGFTIVAVQRSWDGRIVYRVVGDDDLHRFGRPACPENIEIERCPNIINLKARRLAKEW